MIERRERVIWVKDYVTKSNLPANDFVINPYVGCPHACKYCYACFMKRFTGHEEPWGSFIDVKECEKPISAKRLEGKTVFLSSVTDCYNRYEEKYPDLRNLYQSIYIKGDTHYWSELAQEINTYCKQNTIKFINYFYYSELVKDKMEKKREKK